MFYLKIERSEYVYQLPDMNTKTHGNQALITSSDITTNHGYNQPLRRLSVNDQDFESVTIRDDSHKMSAKNDDDINTNRIIPITMSPPRVTDHGYQQPQPQAPALIPTYNRVAPMQPGLTPVSEKPVYQQPAVHLPSDMQQFEVLWHNLSYNIPKKLKDLLFPAQIRTNILHNISGHFRSGEVTAIMGPSGAGKSTLLEIICGRRVRGVVGEVRIRGVDEVKIGFVPQDNYLLELLTVKETLVFASKLINHKLSGYEHNSIADKTINRFGLEKISETRVNRCSGGQRKRLSIALEIISKPNILILDEPTTGLDSPSCTHVLNILHELAANKTSPVAVVATIHQPSVALFNAFHSIYILTNKGKCIYHGLPRQLVPTMARVDVACDPYTSPADFIIEIAAGDFGPTPIKKLVDVADTDTDRLERLTTQDSRLLLSALTKHRYPFFRHLWLLWVRSQILIYRDPFLTILRLVMCVFSAVSLSILFGREIGKTSGCPPRPVELYATPLDVLSKKFETDINNVMQNVCLLFLGIMVGFLSGLTPTLLNFPKEMHVFHKEYHNGWYSCISYYVAKVISDVPLQVLTPLIYLVITFFWSNQPLQLYRFVLLLFISILLSFLAQSIGECTSAIFMDNQNAAVFAGGLIPLPMILFGGFLVKISRMPFYLQPLSWFSFLRFAFEALMISTYGLGRCQYSYDLFVAALPNGTNVAKPLWAQSLPILMAYVDEQRGIQSPVFDNEEQEEKANIRRLYSVFGAGMMKDGQEVDFNRSLILAFYDITDWYLFVALAILIFYMGALKFLTYFVLLVKLHSTK